MPQNIFVIVGKKTPAQREEMDKILYNKFDKKGISELPVAKFEGRIFVVNTTEEAAKAVDFLLTHSILGIDTETRPSFKKGRIHEVALLQVSTHEICFLFRLNLRGMCAPVIRLLADTSIPKIGLSLHDDLFMLEETSLPVISSTCRNMWARWALKTSACRSFMPTSSIRKSASRQD